MRLAFFNCMLVLEFNFKILNKRGITMSITATVWPIISAVCKAAVFIGADTSMWQPVNKQQELFLAQYVSKHTELKEFSGTEMRAWASDNNETLNKILADEGFSIRLTPFGKGGFGVVSILDVLVKWLHEGKRTEISTFDGTKYAAVRLNKGVDVVQSGKHTLVRIATKSEDSVWMTLADAPLEGFALIEKIKSLRSIVHSPLLDFKNEPNPFDVKQGEVLFPMVDLDQQVDIGWLLGMQLRPEFEISQALQLTKLKLNEKGAHVRSAVAIGVERCAIPRMHQLVIIDKPFYLWIERPGLTHPIFAGYITEADWKEPKDLEGK